MQIWIDQPEPDDTPECRAALPLRFGPSASVRDENAMPEGVRRESISSERDVDELPSRHEPRPIAEFPISFRSLSRVRSALPFEYWRPKARSASGVRPSFSGMQDKVCCVLERTDEEFVLRAPDQTRERGNVILKPAWGANNIRIGINEAFCMTFSALCGDTVPRIGLASYGFDRRFPQAHYFVERFDTEPGAEFVTVNEFLGQETDRRGQVPLPDVLAELAPVLDDGDWDLLMKRLVVSFLVGNGDLHLKNLSFRLRPQNDGTLAVSLAPSYDVVSTTVLGDGELFALPMEKHFDDLPLNERNRCAFREFINLLQNYADTDDILQITARAARNAGAAESIVMDATTRDAYPAKYLTSVRSHLELIAKLAARRAAILAGNL